jgi:signal transduction histidine kinase
LPPGAFSFRVMARNADGVWSSQPASLRFFVEPRLYQRRWFFPSLLVSVAPAVAAGYQLRIRWLRKRFELVLGERNRIARELHDTLLQGLSGITMQLQALWTRLPHSKEKQFLRVILDDAACCSTEARQSIWGLRAPSLLALSFSEKLVQLSDRTTKGKPVQLVCQVEPVSLQELPEAEFELLRIAQEALSNALKHAGARCLTVGLRAQDGNLPLRIEDDGIGLSFASAKSFDHFGLVGMQERASLIGAELSVSGSKEKGTCISISLPIGERHQSGSNSEAAAIHQTT